jgi:DNA-binding MarR family transcriptional regulator
MSLEAEAFVSLLKTTDALARGHNELLKAAGLSVAQYNVLRILRGASATGDTGPGLRCAEVGDRLITRDPDVTRLLDRLEKSGLIVRARSEEDRRVVTTRITQKGLELLAELDEPVEALHKRQLGHLTPGTLRALCGLLEDARSAVGEQCPGEPPPDPES